MILIGGSHPQINFLGSFNTGVVGYYCKNQRISTRECTLIFGFGSYPLKFTYEIPSKFHLRFPPILFHVPQNFPHSSPSNTRCQNQNQSRCQMILILTLILDLAHHLHYWMMMSHPQQLKNQWLMMHTDDNNSNKRT